MNSLSGPDSNSYEVEKNPGVSKRRPDDQVSVRKVQKILLLKNNSCNSQKKKREETYYFSKLYDF